MTNEPTTAHTRRQGVAGHSMCQSSLWLVMPLGTIPEEAMPDWE